MWCAPRPLVLVSAAVLALALVPPPAQGELAILAGGHVLKITSYRLAEEKVVLELPSGGTLVLPLVRVERIVDDEMGDPQASPSPERELQLSFVAGAEVPATPFGELIFEKCRAHGINPRLVSVMAQVESAFRTDAVSAKGARGLLQVMPATAERFGVRSSELFRPEENLEAALRYLRWLMDRFSGEPALVLAAYNAGEASVDRHGGVPPYRETQSYLEKIYSLVDATPLGARPAGRR